MISLTGKEFCRLLNKRRWGLLVFITICDQLYRAAWASISASDRSKDTAGIVATLRARARISIGIRAWFRESITF